MVTSASSVTLCRRANYGGRKGRRALRRLRAAAVPVVVVCGVTDCRLNGYHVSGGNVAFTPDPFAPARTPRSCSACAANPGELHVLGCDVERCALCGWQLIGCVCVYEVVGLDRHSLEEEHPDVYKNGATEEMWIVYDAEVTKVGGRLPWTGIFPGVAECLEFGWYSRWVDGRGWVQCEKGDPGADVDLNRLHGGNAIWSKERRRWVL